MKKTSSCNVALIYLVGRKKVVKFLPVTIFFVDYFFFTDDYFY